jgi:hypothetical protein
MFFAADNSLYIVENLSTSYDWGSLDRRSRVYRRYVSGG